MSPENNNDSHWKQFFKELLDQVSDRMTTNHKDTRKNFDIVFMKVDKVKDDMQEYILTTEKRIGALELTIEQKVNGAKEYAINKIDAKLVTWMGGVSLLVQGLIKIICELIPIVKAAAVSAIAVKGG